jgi:hypothetical protein
MRALSGTVAVVAAQLAESAHGVVTRRDLLDAGVTRNEIARRLRTGALLRGVSRRLPRRAPGAERRGALPRGGQGLRSRGPPLWKGGRLPARDRQGLAATAGGDSDDQASPQGRSDPSLPPALPRKRRHDLAGHPGDEPGPDARRPGRRTLKGRAGPSVPRGRRAPRHDTGPGGGGTRPPTAQPGRRQAASGPAR